MVGEDGVVQMWRAGRHGASVLSGVVDAAVAVVVVAVFWAPPLLTAGLSGRAALGGFLALLVSGALLVRWRLPAVASFVAGAATTLGWLLEVSSDPMLGAAWCLYPAAVQWVSRVGAGVLAGVGVVTVVAAVSALPGGGVGTRVLASIVALGASLVLGSFEGQRLRAVVRQAAAAAAEEQAQSQLRMARDVHDVVGHALSVISAEADVARHVTGAGEHDLRESLADIEHRARAALEEVQGLVRALRSDRTGSTGAAGREESVTLAGLVAAARVSGLEVAVGVDLPELPAETGTVAVRVVQEALSNVVRHAAARRCEVVVRPQGEALLVRVDDDGAGLRSGSSSGSGLAGMRERVEGVGGSLTVTNRLEGGVRVLASLPLARCR